jgi:cobalamin biosynthesis protein CobD/CbiB
MLALTLGQAKTIGILVVIVLIAMAIGSAWLMKTVAQKAVLAAILGLLAILVWTQRASLDDCAERLRAEGLRGDTTCSFFGRDVQISPTRDS